MLSKKTAQPQSLMLIWKLLDDQKFKSIHPNKYGEQFVPLSFFALEDDKIFTEETIAEAMTDLVFSGVIPELYFEKIYRKNTTSPYEVEHMNYEKLYDKNMVNGVLVANLWTLFCNEEYSAEYYATFDAEEAKAWIDNYLQYWADDRLIRYGNNTYRAKRQLEIVGEKIFSLLEDYPDTLLSLKIDNIEEMDMFAALLFMQNHKVLEIRGTTADPFTKTLLVQINLRDEFYTFFNKKDGIVISSLPLRVTDNEKIVYVSPLELRYKNIIYPINRNKLPYHLLEIASKVPKYRVAEEELFKRAGIQEKTLNKDLSNFRRMIRSKFSINEELFSRDLGSITFDKNIWLF